MPGLNLNISSSVIKREAKPIERVDNKLVNSGWSRTASILGGRVRYYEQDGINITAIQGPLGTVIAPSGPVRGAIFGDSAVSINQNTVLGIGESGSNRKGKQNSSPDALV